MRGMKHPIAIIAAMCVAWSVQAAQESLRIAYNYCTLSYTMAFWGKEEWREEIERIHSRGFNAALVMAGVPKVWLETFKEAGYEEGEILEAIPDEAAQAWWNMGNLYGLGGPAAKDEIERNAELGRFIVDEMRKKGIAPILQGYMGFLPPARNAIAANAIRGKWCGLERPPWIDPAKEPYAKIAEAWYRNLAKVYGIEPKFLAGDLFHEGEIPVGTDATEAVKSVQAAQQKAFPGVTWLVQGWQENPRREVLAGLDAAHTTIEFLDKDMTRNTRMPDYGEIPFVWCEVLNFGGNHGLYGGIYKLLAMKDVRNEKMRGWGMLSEGLGTNPVFYDLFCDIANGREVEWPQWLDEWVAKRYGCECELLREAWRTLAKEGGVYDCPHVQEGAVENVMCARPARKVASVSAWGPRKGIWYDLHDVERAEALFAKALEEHPELAERDEFMFDYTDIARQRIANDARVALQEGREEDFLALFDEMEKTLARHRAFRLDEQERGRNKAAFRRMITTWVDGGAPHVLNDYAHRDYAGLFAEYYKPRWERFFGKKAKGAGAGK